jgi:hypothetical protein
VFSGCAEDMCRFPHAIPLVEKRARRISSLARQVGLGDRFEVVPPYDLEDDERPRAVEPPDSKERGA